MIVLHIRPPCSGPGWVRGTRLNRTCFRVFPLPGCDHSDPLVVVIAGATRSPLRRPSSSPSSRYRRRGRFQFAVRGASVQRRESLLVALPRAQCGLGLLNIGYGPVAAVAGAMGVRVRRFLGWCAAVAWRGPDSAPPHWPGPAGVLYGLGGRATFRINLAKGPVCSSPCLACTCAAFGWVHMGLARSRSSAPRVDSDLATYVRCPRRQHSDDVTQPWLSDGRGCSDWSTAPTARERSRPDSTQAAYPDLLRGAAARCRGRHHLLNDVRAGDRLEIRTFAGVQPAEKPQACGQPAQPAAQHHRALVHYDVVGYSRRLLFTTRRFSPGRGHVRLPRFPTSPCTGTVRTPDPGSRSRTGFPILAAARIARRGRLCSTELHREHVQRRSGLRRDLPFFFACMRPFRSATSTQTCLITRVTFLPRPRAAAGPRNSSPLCRGVGRRLVPPASLELPRPASVVRHCSFADAELSTTGASGVSATRTGRPWPSRLSSGPKMAAGWCRIRAGRR